MAINQWALMTVFHSLAIASTTVRLAYRLRVKRLWWDDLWALIMLLIDILMFVIMWALTPGQISHKSISLQIFARWVTLFSYETVVWASRMTLTVTIVRLLPQGIFRRVAKSACYMFGIFYIILFVQKVFFCGGGRKMIPTCPIPHTTAIIELVTDISALVWLSVAPGYMLLSMKLPHPHRALNVAILGCGLVTAGASAAHINFILVKNARWIGITGHLQATIGVLLSNVLVLVSIIYRVFDRNAQSLENLEANSDASSDLKQEIFA